jgi:hypothetical protein
MKTNLLFFAFCLGFAACQETTVQQLDAANRDTIVREVEDMFGRYFSDIKKSGLTAEFSYLDASDDFFWVPPGHTSALTYDSVRTILVDNADAFRRIDYTWERVRINPLSPELAAYTGIISGSLVDTAGNTTRVHMTESGVVIKRLDGWKILCGQSAHLPAPSGK